MFEDSILKAFTTLAICVAGLGALLFILKKVNKKSKLLSGNSVDLQVVSRISLQPKTSLFVVKAGQKTLLVGATEKSVSAIADLTEAPLPNAFSAGKTLNNSAIKPKSANEISSVDSPLSFKSFLKATLQKS